MANGDQSQRNAVFNGLGLFATCFEYTLLIASFVVGNGSSGSQNNVLAIALLSIFSTSFSAAVSLFENASLYDPLATPKVYRRLAKTAIVTDSLALVVSFGLLVFMAATGTSLMGMWFACAFFLSALLLPRFALSICMFLSSLIVLGATKANESAGGIDYPSYSQKRDERAFDCLWIRVTHPIMTDIAGECPGISIVDNAKERIWRAYCELNSYVSTRYMNDPSARIDRHKIAACHAFSILKVVPLVIDYNKVEEGSRASFCNERLALRVCCSVLASFLLEAFTEVGGEGLSSADKQRALERIHGGVRFPQNVGHGGTYVSSVLRSFRFARLESRFDVPMLSLLAYDWESWLLDEDLHNAIIGCYARGAFTDVDSDESEADDSR